MPRHFAIVARRLPRAAYAEPSVPALHAVMIISTRSRRGAPAHSEDRQGWRWAGRRRPRRSGSDVPVSTGGTTHPACIALFENVLQVSDRVRDVRTRSGSTRARGQRARQALLCTELRASAGLRHTRLHHVPEKVCQVV